MKPILVVMAAGIGSRYGGLKQTDPVGVNGELIIDYSVYDAVRAGFQKVVFIINQSIEKDFKEIIGNRLETYIDVEYAYQELNDIPESFMLSKDRVKPLGTGHAIYTSRHLIDDPFAVINADDYYGREAFEKIFNYLSKDQNNEFGYTMVGYQLKNTVTENGHVSRGVCQVDSESNLQTVIERTHIEQDGERIFYIEDDQEFTLKSDSIVSMNMWGFMPSFLKVVEHGLIDFLKNDLSKNPLKGEYFLPFVVDAMLQKNECEVKVLSTVEKWYGVTYSEDKVRVVDAIKEMISEGKYPEKLWEV